MIEKLFIMLRGTLYQATPHFNVSDLKLAAFFELSASIIIVVNGHH
jgi:hypothetical protein